MTTEEKLADWLERITPEPPRAISVDALRPRSRNRAWLPALAAACVVLIVLVTLAIANRQTSNHSAPAVTGGPTRSSASTGPRSSVATTTPANSPSAARLPPRFWQPKAVSSVHLGSQLVADAGVVYATTSDGLAAINLQGRVLATAAGRHSSPVIANSAVWSISSTARGGGGSVTVTGLAERTLRPQASVVVNGLGHGDWASLQPAPNGQLLLAYGHEIVWLDPAVKREVRRLRVDAVVGAVESSVTGHVYVVVNTSNGGLESQLRVLDPQTGSVLDSVDEGAASISAISDGGVWLYVGGGHHAEIDYVPFNDLSHAVDVDDAGGGAPPTVSIIGSTAWLGGWTKLTCSDAVTGQPRSSVAMNGRFTDIFAITRTRGRTFAVYAREGSGHNYLVELHPPAACTP